MMPSPLSLSMRFRRPGFHQSDILGERRAPDSLAKAATGLALLFLKTILVSKHEKRNSSSLGIYKAFHIDYFIEFSQPV